MSNSSEDSNVYKFNNILGTGTTSGSVTNTSIAGTVGTGNTTLTTANCITGGIAGFPYYSGGLSYYSYPALQHYDIQLRKVENGWLMLKGGKEYILKSLEEVSKYHKETK